MTRLQKITKLWISLSDEEHADFKEIMKLWPRSTVNFQRALRLSKLKPAELFNAIREGQVKGRTPLRGKWTKTYGELVKSGQLDWGGEGRWEISHPSLKAYVLSEKRKREEEASSDAD